MGHGLSYTQFRVTAAGAPPHEEHEPELLRVGENTTVKIEVKNVGVRAGDEVILALFIPGKGTVPAAAPAARLKQQMFAFERVSLAPGSKTVLSFDITPEMLELSVLLPEWLCGSDVDI